MIVQYHRWDPSILFRSSFADTASALVLVAVAVAVAANGSRVAGFVAAVSASLWFDFLLTRPYERFAISHQPDVETAVSLFVAVIAVTELAARADSIIVWLARNLITSGSSATSPSLSLKVYPPPSVGHGPH